MSRKRHALNGRARAIAIMLTAVVGSCTTTPAPSPTGTATEIQTIMATIGPSPLFAGLDRGDRWLIVGNPSHDRVRMAVDEGLPVVHIAAGSDDLVMGRRIDQHLLAVPFLTWRWKMSPHTSPYHPVRITVGFADTARPLDPKDTTLRHLPDDVRILELVWNERALRRGTMDKPQDREPARYTVRGGQESLGKSWQEGVDLISLHDQAWPGLSTSRTRIVFVAVRAVPAAASSSRQGALSAALISNLRLIR